MTDSRSSAGPAWLWKMAWRDSRTHRGRLLLFMFAIVMGVAALVAITAFGENLQRSVDEQARTLLGADLLIRSRSPFSAEAKALIDSIEGQKAAEVDFSSMGYFPKNNATRLVRVKAIDPGFPFYGKFETTPPAAALALHSEPNGVLVDQGLMIQYEATIGDTLKIGAKAFVIIGRLDKVPGQAGANATIAPRVYIPMADLEATGLIQFGSRALHNIYVKLPQTADALAIKEGLETEAGRYRLQIQTVEDRKRALGEAMENLYRFLNLVAFVALLLGCLGVASAIQVYIRQKLDNIAVLRCLGAGIGQTFRIYLIQAACLGFFGAVAGILVGLAIQNLLPGVVGQFLVVDLEMQLSWPAIWQGLLIGLGMTLLFALVPLMSIRRVSPLLAIRSSFENGDGAVADPLRRALYLLIFLVVWAFAAWWGDGPLEGFIFVAGISIAFGCLSGIARLIMAAARRFFPRGWPYIWRQSLANLYRPNNQTLVLMLALGLGTFLITNLYITQNSLLKQLAFTGSGDQPNLILFDIQTDQNEAVLEEIERHNMPVMQNVPIVTMRLNAIGGRPVEEIRKDSTNRTEDWALVREYRSTYRDTLIDTETIQAGQWQSHASIEDDTIAISLESGIADELAVSVGDVLEIDVQGVPLTTRIGSIREVDWQQMQPNFFIVFPAGVLEDAPQIKVVVTRAPTPEVSAMVQRDIVRRFGNISAVDLGLILKTVENILGQVAFVIRFMALFSILTGLIVLAAAIVTSRFQRIRESVLLRTLGASQKQIRQMLFLEYLFLGVLASITGIFLALIASWGLAEFMFNVDFRPEILPVIGIGAGVVALTVFLGVVNSRGIAGRPPLEVLRGEA